ncbi:MAG: DMT family transporter [Rubrivivax sp.]|nr:DMT family transporter [Rubrivivax sp.]HRY87757.1 DMT family transporter [Rubrivivax sp.]
MRPRDLIELLLLSLLWGGAFLFTRAAVPEFGPAPLVALRLGIGALLVLPVVAWRGKLAQMAQRPRQMLVLGLAFTALPFWLLSWSALHIGAGLLAVLNATAPMFAGIVGHFVFRERLGRTRAAGLAIGFAGVALLVSGGNLALKTADGALALAAVLLAAAAWGIGGNYARRRLGSVDPMVTTVVSLAAASLALAPLAWATWPAQPPSLRAWAEIVFLGVASSGLGMLMYFRLLNRIGAVRAISVTFLNPVVAIVGGALYLGEAITPAVVGGTAVVLFGTALSLGLIGPARAAPAGSA